MINNKRLLAVIPARSGSKRLPNKNVRELGGKPLIAWTIEASVKSNYIDYVLVSTNDIKVAEISEKLGANVPFLRPEKLSTDDASSIEVAFHSIQFLKNCEKSYDYVVFLQPTSPLRTTAHIDEAIEYLELKQANAVISVSEIAHNPLWINTLPCDNRMNNFLLDSVKNKRSQDLPSYYRLNGAIYICKISHLFKEKSFFLSNNIYAYVMDELSSVDIDTKMDLEFCSFLLRKC